MQVFLNIIICISFLCPVTVSPAVWANWSPRYPQKRYRAVYDYAAADEDEVSFMDGDVIVDVQQIDEGWMYGRVERTGQQGMLPANYVESIWVGGKVKEGEKTGGGGREREGKTERNSPVPFHLTSSCFLLILLLSPTLSCETLNPPPLLHPCSAVTVCPSVSVCLSACL